MMQPGTIELSLRAKGFALVGSSDFRDALGAADELPDWESFAASWNDLHVDQFMADAP